MLDGNEKESFFLNFINNNLDYFQEDKIVFRDNKSIDLKCKS